MSRDTRRSKKLINEVIENYNGFIKKYFPALSERSSLFGQSSEDKAITWQKIRTVLKPNEVAVEMVRYRHFNHVFIDSVVYAALYLKNDKATPKPKVALITNGKDLEHKYFKFYRNSIIYKIDDRYSYDQYWKPIKVLPVN